MGTKPASRPCAWRGAGCERLDLEEGDFVPTPRAGAPARRGCRPGAGERAVALDLEAGDQLPPDAHGATRNAAGVGRTGAIALAARVELRAEALDDPCRR